MDEKLKSLVMDNIVLQNEVNVLKATLKSERWRSIGLLFTFLFAFLVLYVIDKFKFSKPKMINEQDEEQKLIEKTDAISKQA